MSSFFASGKVLFFTVCSYDNSYFQRGYRWDFIRISEF